MHGHNPTQDAIEEAFTFAADRGLIKAWRRVPFAGGARHAKWEVDVHPHVSAPVPAKTVVIRTYHEGNLFAAALSSAWNRLAALTMTAGELWDQTDPGQHPELSEGQVELLDVTRRVYQDRLGASE